MEMTPGRWQEVRRRFEQALEQPVGARQGWVAALAGLDPDLAAEVRSLLAALETEPDRFERPAAVPLGDLLDLGAGPALRVGDHVGPYRIVAEVGQGGMGVVYEAQRDDDQYRKRVAVKTIARGRDSELILRRFRHERQILARLEHRNIAILLDGGVSDTGLPFLVMEFVEGEPIDRFAELNRLGLRERLQLFRQVCGAVQHAHGNLVIHRDLKPANMLVTADGTVKLLDFGIAKLLDDKSSPDDAGMTQAGGAPLTAAYASPEQVAGAAVATATDVFSLGVVLYQLLTGSHPFNQDRPGSDEVRRRIREETPGPPSAAVRDREIPAGLPAPSSRLSRLLEGDLDSIVLMALRKEPGRRYTSVEQLSEDLRRFLEGEPVLARPDSLAYRAEKFVRRNRAAVMAGGVGILALVAGLGATAWQARVAGLERDRAEIAAAAADRQRARAEAVNRFLQNMLGAADPSWYSSTDHPGPETSIGEVFQAAGKRAEVELADEPEVLADALRTLGRANQALRRGDLATAQLERARELHLAAFGPASREVAIDDHELGMAELQRGDLSAAERRFRSALAVFREAGDSTSDEYGRTIADLGLALATSGRPAEAEPLVRVAAAHRWAHDSTSVANAILLGNLGLVLSQQGKFEEAEPAYREALAAFARVPDREYFEKGYTLGNLAIDLLLRGRTTEALPLVEAQIAHFERLLSRDHPTVGYGYVNLARVLQAMSEPGRALVAARHAESLFRAAVPAGHPDLARTDAILGLIHWDLGNPIEAERRLRSALAIRRQRLAPESPHTADAAAALGRVLAQRGRLAEAESLLVAAERTFRTGLRPGDPRTAAVRQSLIDLYTRQGRAAEARAWRDSLPARAGG